MINNGNLVGLKVSAPPNPPPVEPVSASFEAVRGRSEADLAAGWGIVNPIWGTPRLLWRWDGQQFELVFEVEVVDGVTHVRATLTTLAANGRVVAVKRLAARGQATGGVHLRLFGDSDTLMPLAHLAVTGGARNDTTDAAGRFSVTGATLVGTLSGPYGDLEEDCGPATASGDSASIWFGASLSTDCGSALLSPGNTRAARTAFFHVNRIRDLYRSLDEGTSWLDSPVGIVTDYPYECQNSWDGTRILLNAQVGSSVCGNAGENPGIIYHEWGHAYEQNSHGAPHDFASAEAYADVTSLLQLHGPCIAAGFFLGGNMSPEDGSPCDGYRELDFTVLNPPVPATPQNIAQPPYNCPPASPDYSGILGLEPHCEGHIMSEAMWELGQAFMEKYGAATGWDRLLRLWIGASVLMDSAWEIGDVGPPVVSDGCGIVNWFEALRVVDDDNGNLSDGTPDGAELFSAFNNHGIACAPEAPWNVDYSTCPLIAAPKLFVAVNPTADAVNVFWSPVAGATGYEVLRSELGPGGPFTSIAILGPAASSMTDDDGTSVAVHWYAVVALGEGNCRSSLSGVVASSSCVAAVTLVAPQDGQDLAGSAPVLAWSLATGATHYSLYLSPSPDPSYFGSFGTTSLTVPAGLLTAGVTYYWKVVAYNDQISCPPAVSKVWSFSVQSSCTGAVALASPPLGGIIATVTPTLRWQAASNATHYSLYLSSSASPSYFNSYTGTQATIPAGLLAPGVTYYWKVVAYNDNISCPPAVSPVWSFVALPCAGPVTLVSPTSGAAAPSATPTLSWAGSANATYYSLYLSLDPAPGYFGSYLGIAATIPAGILGPGVTYYWKVLAYNDNTSCNASASSVWSFSVPSPCTGAVALISPASGSTVSTSQPTLLWQAAANATHYSLYLAPNESPMYFGSFTSTSATIDPGVLTPGVTYFWKVVAYNDNISCPPAVSPTFSFTVPQ